MIVPKFAIMMDAICTAYEHFKNYKFQSGDYIHLTMVSTICTFGTLTNFIAIIVLSRKKLIKNPNNLFLIVISICGFIALIASFVLFLLDITYRKLSYQHTQGVIIVLPLCYLLCAIHTWMTVFLAVWRVVTLDFPMNTSMKMSIRNVMINIVIVIIAVCVFHIPHYQSLAVQTVECNSTSVSKNNSSLTEFEHAYYFSSRNPYLERIGFYVHTIGMQIFPCALLLVLTILLMERLLRARNRRRNLKRGSISTTAPYKRSISKNSSSTTGSTVGSERSNDSKKSDKFVIETSHALILIFIFTLICDIPVSLKIIGELISDEEKVIATGIIKNIGIICNLLKLVNCSSVLIFLCITSGAFRSEFMKAFSFCSCSERRDYKPTGTLSPSIDGQKSSTIGESSNSTAF